MNWNPFCDDRLTKLYKMADNKPKKDDQQPAEQNTVEQKPVNEKAEKYIKEAGSIEDIPDAEEQKEAEDEMKKD
jgi:hypothetical protein